MLFMVLAKLEMLAIMLCVSVLVGLAVYTNAILEVPGTHGVLQKAEAIRRSIRISVSIFLVR